MRLFLFLITFSFVFPLFSQNTNFGLKIPDYKNSISLELGGVSGWYGLHYDRRLYKSNNEKTLLLGDLGYSYLTQNDFKNQSFTLQLVMDFKSRTNDNISYFIGVCGNYFVRDLSQYVQRGNLSYYSNYSKGSAFLTGKIGFNLKITKRFYGSLSVVYIPKNERTYEFIDYLKKDNTQSDSILDYVRFSRLWFGMRIGYKF